MSWDDLNQDLEEIFEKESAWGLQMESSHQKQIAWKEEYRAAHPFSEPRKCVQCFQTLNTRTATSGRQAEKFCSKACRNKQSKEQARQKRSANPTEQAKWQTQRAAQKGRAFMRKWGLK